MFIGPYVMAGSFWSLISHAFTSTTCAYVYCPAGVPHSVSFIKQVCPNTKPRSIDTNRGRGKRQLRLGTTEPSHTLHRLCTATSLMLAPQYSSTLPLWSVVKVLSEASWEWDRLRQEGRQTGSGVTEYTLPLSCSTRFAQAKKCSNEGRALMHLDYQQYRTKVERMSNIRYQAAMSLQTRLSILVPTSQDPLDLFSRAMHSY